MKKIKPFILSFVLTLVVGMICALSYSAISDAKTVNLAKDKSANISKVIKLKNKKVKYKSKNKKIATVSQKGIIKAKKPGSTKIIVTYKKKSIKKVTVNVKVYSKAAKSIKLNKKSAELKTGDVIKLKSVISPSKKVCKEVVWNSSNSNIAKVDNKGIVTAIAPGKVKIKASTIDGSKKSVICKITVTRPDGVEFAQIIDSTTINIKLNKPQSLGVSDIKIETKNDVKDTYGENCIVRSVYTDDMINYEVIVDFASDPFHFGQYVKLTTQSLPQKVYEFEVKKILHGRGPKDLIVEGKAGQTKIMEQVEFDGYIDGNLTYKVKGLPSGIDSEVEEGKLYIKGTPVSLCDNVIAIATATDSNGNSVTKKIRFLVGTDSVIVAYVKPIFLLSNKSSMEQFKVYSAGGRDFSRKEFVKDENYNKLISLNSIKQYRGCDCLDGNSMSAGQYSLTYKIYDNTDSNVYINKTINITVRDGVKITGRLVDAAGSPMCGKNVYAVNTLTNYIHVLSFPLYSEDNLYAFKSEALTDNSGYYEIRAYDGYSYKICNEYEENDACSYVDNLSAAGAVVNLKSTYYKVTLSTNINFLKYFLAGNGTYVVVNDNSMYVHPGTYDLKNSSTINSYNANGKVNGRYDMRVSFTVTNDDIVATPTVIDQFKGALSVDAKCSIVVDKESGGYVTFTAPEDGEYNITSDFVDMRLSCEIIDMNSHDKLDKSLILKKGEVFEVGFYNYQNYDISVNNILVKKSLPVNPEGNDTIGDSLVLKNPIDISINANSSYYIDYIAAENDYFEISSDEFDAEVDVTVNGIVKSDVKRIYAERKLYKNERLRIKITNKGDKAITIKNLKLIQNKRIC